MNRFLGLVCTVFLVSICMGGVFAQENNLPKGLQGVSIGGVWYLSYQAGESGGDDYNQFTVKRGYINIKKKIKPWFSGRITPDVHQDDTGDYKVRLKYVYAQFDLPSCGFFYQPFVEWGLVHMPWLDFEEHLNYYRLQDTMFMERNSLFNSADVGFTFLSLLGGEIDKEYQQKVNDKYPGRYGSVAVGVYNGGGYHASENNNNKVPEIRISIRPLPDNLPGLQFSYFGIFGKGNISWEPDWIVNAGFISLESERYILTGTIYAGKGRQNGEINSSGVARQKKGYSAFGELKLPESHLSLIGRYDWFDGDTDLANNANSRVIFGLAYHLPGHSKVLFDYDRVMYENPGRSDDARFQTTIEVNF